MVQHSSRKHAFWAASATARNMFCPGALALNREAPPGGEREAAAWGTCCHQVAEQCLETGKDAVDYFGEEQQCGRFSFTIDDEMAATAQEYLDYCRKLIDENPKCQWWAEENYTLNSLDTPFDAGGTGDFVIYMPDKKLLEIVDLKGGKGVVVEVDENPQTRTYALGAMLHHEELDVTHVRATIVQPRAPHKDGRIRSETFHIIDLVEWSGGLLAAMRRSKAAMDAHDATKGNQVLLDEWRDRYLKPGKCQFCPSEGVCPALRNDAISVAHLWYDDQDKPHVGNALEDNSPEQLARDLDAFDMIQDWINARRVVAHNLAEQGVTIPGYVLAEKRGNRRWNFLNEGDQALQLQERLGWSEDDVYQRRLKSPAQIERSLPGAAKNKIKDFWHTVVSGTNLVKASKTQRPAASTLSERFFQKPQGDEYGQSQE